MFTRLNKLRELIERLPPINRALLKYLLEFLVMVCRNSEENKMTTSNLAIIFGPNLLQPRDGNAFRLIEDARHVNGITKSMIDEFDYLLGVRLKFLIILSRIKKWLQY